MAPKLPRAYKTTDRARSIGMLAVQVKGYQERLVAEIREGHKEGMSLRALADAAAISHEQVRRLISQDQSSGS